MSKQYIKLKLNFVLFKQKMRLQYNMFFYFYLELCIYIKINYKKYFEILISIS